MIYVFNDDIIIVQSILIVKNFLKKERKIMKKLFSFLLVVDFMLSRLGLTAVAADD